MKKNLFSILLVVVMTLAMVACGTQETTNDVPVSTETIEATVESGENSEAVSETEQATEAPVDEVVENAESASEPETSTEENSEAVSEPENAEVASTPDSEAVDEASEPETSEPEFTVTDLNATKYAIQVVNVRSGPSTDYDKIGGLTTNQEITVNGVCDQTGWFRFDLNGTVAFVSNRYVSDSKVEKPAASETPSNGGNSTANSGSAASNWYDGYDYGIWYDMGEYYFYLCKTDEEQKQVHGDCINGRSPGNYLWEPELLSRYPDRKVYYAGSSANGYEIVFASTCIDEPWYRPKFIWE